jgi:RNA 3'-terminal phosphate cyclase (ATP)
MVEIDGSFGEGGGQILRTSLGLSCLLEAPFRIRNIRKRRKKPGLMPQHLTCVRAAARICGANVEGGTQGSTELTFRPGPTLAGVYDFSIGTAGSTSLVLQAILPPLLAASEASTVTLSGGTHVPMSPPFHYIRDVFLPALEALGARVSARIEAYGFYPRGGGTVTFSIPPCGKLAPWVCQTPGELVSIEGVSAVGRLPLSIATRQREAALEALAGHNALIETAQVRSLSPGTFVFLKVQHEHAAAGFCALGERGKRAETVGLEAAEELRGFLSSGACLDHHLADQMILYLALAEGQSIITASKISDHLRTNMYVIEQFTDAAFTIQLPDTVTVKGCGCFPGIALLTGNS